MSILASTDKYKSKRQLTRLPRLNPIAMRLSVICCQPSATLFAIRHSLPSIERKDEILEAHRSGISIHRIAQIFREPNVDISTQDLMRAIRLFIEEGEGTKGKTSIAEATGNSEKAAQKPVTYQVPEPPSALVREEEFVKQLRLAPDPSHRRPALRPATYR